MHSCTHVEYRGRDDILGGMITANDDGWVRTHDDMRALLKYAALGATVIFDPVKRAKRHSAQDASREFTVVLDAAPHHAVNHTDIYALPCRAAPMFRRVRDLCDTAQRCIEPLAVRSHTGQSE
jgi:hypothetical protein